MRNFTRWVNKCLAITILVISLAGFSALAPAIASAHTISSSSVPHNLVSKTVRPYCSGSVSASPTSEAIKRGQTAVFDVYWSCEGNVYVVVSVSWGDNGSSSYTCWANCSSGSQTMSHTYNQTGDWTVVIVMGGNASGEIFGGVGVR